MSFHCTLIVEKYLAVLDVKKIRYFFVNFRVGSHDLEIERGRYSNIPRQNRICTLCNSSSLEDEFHFLLNCEFYSELRMLHIPRKYFSPPTINKFNVLMSCKNETTIKSVAVFLFYAFKKRKNGLIDLQRIN